MQPTAAVELEGEDVEVVPWNLLALPHHLLTPLLVKAGGASALQSTRSTSTAWKTAVDSLVVRAACTTLPSSAAPLASLPQLHTVDFSCCVEPMPRGRLARLLQELSRLPQLKTLHLSTWSMAQQQESQPVGAASTASSSTKPPPAAAPGATAASTAGTAGVGSAGAAVAATGPPPQYDIILPAQAASITQLQELIISTCADVSGPAARRLELPAGLMRLQHLTRLELLGFLPPVHHLRGLQHLQHLSISVQHGTSEAAGDAAGVRVQQSVAAVKAACAAVQAIPALVSLQLQLSARQVGHPVEGTSVVAGVDAGELLELLSTSPTPPAAGTGAAAPPAGAHTGTSTQRGTDGDSSSSSSRTHAPSGSTRGASGSSSSAAMSKSSAAGPACKLRQLRLTYSGGLYHLPAKFAAACSGLQELDLSYSRLTVEAAAVLGSLSCCTSLCLAESRMQQVPASWAALTQLQILDVSGNPLGALPPFFSRLRALNKLVVASTHLLVLPGFVSSLTSLQHLSLASNKLQELPPELCACTGLVHLDASKNRLLALPEQFSALAGITQLSLTGNHLEALPSGLHGLRCLSHLGLALNYYKIWRHAVPCFAALAHTLQELELQHTATVLNDSEGFLEVVGQLTALTSLAAGSNQMSDLPEAWRQLKRLKVLQLSHNAMETMPIALLSLTTLTYLDLSYNRLMALPFWIGSSKLQQLKRLNLAKNHLTTLPTEMGRLSGLTQLQLQGNNLAAVPPVLGCLHRLRLLNLGGNYKLKEGGLGQQLAGLGSLRDVVLPYRLDKAAGELRAAGKAVSLD